MKRDGVSFPSTDGLQLEGELDHPETAVGVVVICHAHPAMQGTMKSPLLLAIAEDCVTRGLGVLRFNFRGVGESGGAGTDGVAEVADAAGALAFMRATWPDLPSGLAGWSFGGAVAARAAARDRALAACALVAPATRERPGVTAGLPPAREMGLTAPTLVVCGSNDEVVSPHDCRAWAEGALRVRYEEIKAANHFFWAKYEALTEIVGTFLQHNMIREEAS
ncbi:MAG: alpha/beta hydrolase [Actinomycetota bacterium]